MITYAVEELDFDVEKIIKRSDQHARQAVKEKHYT